MFTSSLAPNSLMAWVTLSNYAGIFGKWGLAKQVRTVEIGSEAWLVGRDVAAALGYSNPRDALAKHVDEEDRKSVAFRDGTSGNPNVTIINESGLYALVLPVCALAL